MLDDIMKDYIAKQLPMVATVSKDGIPYIGPKRSLRIYNDETLLYNETTGGQTLQNILDGSKIAVAVVDREALDGYRFLGRGEVVCEGEIWQDVQDYAKALGRRAPKCAVLIHIEAVYSLRTGEMAGQKIIG